MLSDVTEEVDITLGSLQTEVALGLATRAIVTTGFKVIKPVFFFVRQNKQDRLSVSSILKAKSSIFK